MALCCSLFQHQQQRRLPEHVLFQLLPLQTQTPCQPPAQQLWLTSSSQPLQWRRRPQPAWQLQTLLAQEKALRQRVSMQLQPSWVQHLHSSLYRLRNQMQQQCSSRQHSPRQT
jgi:hypothetical protein